MSNLYMSPACGSSDFCRIQPADSNSDWIGPWSSTGNAVEGWGVQVFKFTPGSASPAPLTMRFTGDIPGMDGVIMSRASADGIYTRTDINFNGAVGTALVPGFGNITDEIWAITWLASNQGDCDYTSCGSSYPQGVIDVEAARITSPASLSLNSTVLADRDGDSLVDTAEIEFNVLSNAFFEDLDVEIQVKNSSGIVLDTMETRVQAGGGVDVSTKFWYTAKTSEVHTFHLTMTDMLGDVVDTTQTGAQFLDNMRPVANSSLEQVDVQTWDNVLFVGNGFDAWGLSLANNTLPYLDDPVAYAWDFGDGNTSTEESVLHSYALPGNYTVVLVVTNASGEADPEVKDNYITILPTPNADFDPMGLGCTVPLTLSFEMNGGTQVNYSYAWDFGNGNTENISNPPDQTYNTVGSYDISLIVTDTDNGCADTVVENIIVSNYQADFIFPESVCVGEAVEFQDNSTAGANQWEWNFGGLGSSNEENPSFTFAGAGTYNIQLATNNTTSGCSGSLSGEIVVEAV